MATLNPEPALPSEREKAHLPPKSYVDAVAEEPPVTGNGNGNGNGNGVNGTSADSAKGVNGSNGTNGSSTLSTTDEKETGPSHTASVLRIVDTGAPAKTAKEKKDGGRGGSEDKAEVDGKEENTRPELVSMESKEEYTATGIDDAPRTPPRKKHRKAGSQKSNSTSESQITNGTSKAKEESEDGTSSLSTAEKILGSNGTKTKENNEDKSAGKSEDGTPLEKVEGKKNGHKLVSIKPSAEYEEQIRRKRKEAGLASGKKAGERWEQSAIRWAPMNVPLQRRLQTCVVLFHTLCIALSVSAFFFLCAIPLFWPLLIPYMIYCMSSNASTNGTLSRRSDFLRSLPVWSLFAQYFPARLHRTEELPPTRKYIFGYHPHGIISHGAFAAFGTEALGFSQLFPGIKNTLLTLDSNFRIPIYRDYALAMGIASVSKESCENLLSKGGPNKEGMGRAITIVVGGARESLDAQPYSLRLVLARRKGFIKLALRTGADLVPVLAFGENDLYDQFKPNEHPKIHRFQLLVKKLLGFTIPLFHARGVFNYDVGLMPYRRPLNIVVGRPVKVEREERPSQESIDKLHGLYVTELERLWELWKDEFAKNREGEMEILE